MGLLDRIRSALTGAGAPEAQPRSRREGHAPAAGEGLPALTFSATISEGNGCVEIAGTTTNSKGAAQRVFTAAGYGIGGLLYRDGHLVPEPDNAADPHAVAIHVAGERVGYLPGFIATRVHDQLHGTASVPVQMWATEHASELRVRAFAWLGGGAPEWDYDATHPAPVTPGEKAEEQARRSAELRESRLAAGGEEARTELVGHVRGKHFTEWPDTVRQLKREERFSEALNLLYELIEATERDARDRGYKTPAPWYTEQAAIVHRKLKDYAGEVAVLERYASFSVDSATTVAQRLEKARALRDKATGG